MSSATGSRAISASASGSPVYGSWLGEMGVEAVMPASYARPLRCHLPRLTIGGVSDHRPLAIPSGRVREEEPGTFLGGRTILVEGGRVQASAGPDDGPPDDARVIDLGGLTVLPGLI